MKCFFFLILLFVILVTCGPDFSGLKGIGKNMADSLTTKYDDQTADFWSKVDGTYVNSESSSLSFDRNTHAIEINTLDYHVKKAVIQVSKTCPSNIPVMNCDCDKEGCEYTSLKILPCSSHLDGVVTSIHHVKDPLNLQIGNLVSIQVSRSTLAFFNKTVETAVANKNGSVPEQLRYGCEQISFNAKANETIEINLTNYDSHKVTWTSGSTIGVLLAGPKSAENTYFHYDQSKVSASK